MGGKCGSRKWVNGMVNCKILYCLKKNKKIYIDILNNYINYIFIDIIIIYCYIY